MSIPTARYLSPLLRMLCRMLLVTGRSEQIRNHALSNRWWQCRWVFGYLSSIGFLVFLWMIMLW